MLNPRLRRNLRRWNRQLVGQGIKTETARRSAVHQLLVGESENCRIQWSFSHSNSILCFDWISSH